MDPLEAALALFGILGGPLLGLFSLGLFFSMANSWGALVGFIVAVIWNIWLGISQITFKPVIYQYPTSIAGCNITGNNSLLAEIPASEYTYDPASYNLAAHHRSGVGALYDISYQWMACIGCFMVIFVGLIVSAATGCNRTKPVEKKLLTPFFHQICCCLPARARNVLKLGVEPPSEDGDEEFENDSNGLEMGELDRGALNGSADLMEEKGMA